MKYQQLNTFRKHVEQAAPHHLCSCYLLIAKDPFLRKMALDLLLYQFKKQNRDPSLRYPTQEGDKVNLAELIETLYSPSLFGGAPLLHVRQVEKMKKEDIDSLRTFLPKIPRGSYLVLSAESFAKNTRFYRDAEQNGVVLDVEEPKPWEKENLVAGWVASLARKAKKQMAPSLCSFFVQRIGTDLSSVQNEMEKLLCYLGCREEVTAADIEAICSETAQASIWKASDAIFAGQITEAIIQGRILLQQGNPLILLLKQLRSQFSIKYSVAGLLSSHASLKEIGAAFPHFKGALLQKNIDQAKKMGLGSTIQALLAIDACERESKQSSCNPELLLERLLLQLGRVVNYTEVTSKIGISS